MNKQKFVRYLRDPNSLDSESLKSIESLLADRPYFQGAHTLLAKGSKLHQTKDAAKRISTAAVYSTDRILLKKFINDQLFFLDPLEVHESHEADLERDIEKTLKSNRLATTKVKTILTKPNAEVAQEKNHTKSAPDQKDDAHIALASKSSPRLESTVPVSKAESTDLDSLIDEIYRDLEELKTNRSKLREIEENLEEEEAVDEAVKRATAKTPKNDTKQSQQDDEIKITPTDSTPSAPTENEAPPEESSSPISKTADEPIINEEPSAVEKDEPVKKIGQSRSARVSTATPIDSESVEKPVKKISIIRVGDQKPPEKKVIANEKPAVKSSITKAQPEKKTAKPVAKAKTSKKKAAPKLKVKENQDRSEDIEGAANDKVEQAKVMEPTSQDKIISEFIRVNPSIPKPKKGSSTKKQEDLSTESTQLHPDVASEYLAEIYTEQGRIERACQIYEALMIRFPEKSLYFADIVQKLIEKN